MTPGLVALLPKWFYISYEAAGIVRTRIWGSRRTVLQAIQVSSVDGWSVWIFTALGWTLTIGAEDAVAEGLADVLEAHPRTRHRTWRLDDHRVVQLSYAPESA